MKRASQFFFDADRQAIEAAVAVAEDRTGVEIIPAVATASGRYDRAEDLFGLVVALATLAAAWIFFQDVGVSDSWAVGSDPVLGLGPVLAIVLVGFIAGTALATWIPLLRLPFIPAKEMQAEVARAADAAFFHLRVRKTAEATGILIFISLYEHRVEVLGDDRVAAKLSQEDWNAVRDLIVEGLKNGKPAEGMIRGIEKCGDLCLRHFPPQPAVRDQLSNELRFID